MRHSQLHQNKLDCHLKKSNQNYPIMCNYCTSEYEEYSGSHCPVCFTECNFEVWTAVTSIIPVTIRQTGCFSRRFEGKYKQVLFCHRFLNYPKNVVVKIGFATQNHCENRDDDYDWVNFTLTRVPFVLPMHRRQQ